MDIHKCCHFWSQIIEIVALREKIVFIGRQGGYKQHRFFVYNWVEYQTLQYLFKSELMRNRKGYDWSKPFKFVATKKEFDQLDTNEETFIVIQADQPKTITPHKKEQIPVPKIETVKKVAEVKKFAKITPNYIRLPAHLNLPSPHNYELSEVDHAFVKTHQDRFYFKGKRVLTHDFLKKCITELELKAGKDMNLPRNKGWMTAFLEKEHKQLLQMDLADQFCETIYNYWKNRRQELKFPLLRLLWKPNPDQYNHMLAFRPREREKRSLRRTNRVVQDQIIEQLYEEFDLASKIVDRIQMREQLKMKQVSLQLSSFYSQVKSLVGVPDYMEQLKPEDRIKDKERMRGFHASLQNYKNRKMDLENMVLQQPGQNQVDQKQSIVNFLSTVAAEAAALGISYQTFFSTSVTQNKPVPVIQPATAATTPVTPEPKAAIAQQYVHFSMQHFEDMLIRTFDQQQSPVHHVKPCKDYLQLKRRRVDGYYFGSDDQGEVKETKKNVAVSFKRYLQMQHMTRTISATSEN